MKLTNKKASIILLISGVLSTIPERDITFMVLSLFIAVPLWFSKKNWID